MPTNFLQSINSPDDLKRLRVEDLENVSRELRQFIIDVVSNNPGHFGASLGVVELTVALHYIFNTPNDRIIWDVGHQAYGHKILTGRREIFHTNRKYKGISGFPKRSESEYDSFGTGHSATSISAGLGMAVASSLKGENRHTVAIIGDGSMTGGLAFEGLNHGGTQKSNLLVILNDNNMAIDPNVGALKEYLLDITTSQTYNKLKSDIWNLLGKMNRLGTRSMVQKLENALKSALLKQSNLFESLGFRYFGPVDGHDVVYLTQILNDLKNIPGPKLLHCVTVKGKGFTPAEENQTAWHAPGIFDKDTGERIVLKSDKPSPPRFQDVFGHTMVELAKQNEKIVGITPAMPSGCSMNIMMETMPDRTFDVGIAEQHAVTFAAGLAAEGLVPFCNIYSSFMQRAYDQVIHDVVLQNLNVVFCLDRGGLVGEDGATHHGVFDIAYMRTIPNVTICSPLNEEELRNLMYTAQLPNMGPWSIRYPRGNGSMVDWQTPMKQVEVGTGRILSEGTDIAILSFGPLGIIASQAVEKLKTKGISAAHYDMRFVKPIDTNILTQVGKRFNTIITIEDGAIQGGFGSAVLEWLNDNGYQTRVIRMGIPDRFIEHGTPQELYRECSIDAESIYKTARSIVAPKMIGKVV
ncbi:MAG: 1-deoxy-D-xylulose-5-phosphate synthase [Tenuifilaceae bacterium]|nr:1-deoxy-D-xylulose-5-phosphate synthase [Tenuifilaceae bacterium]